MEDSKSTQARDRFPGESLNITLYGVFFRWRQISQLLPYPTPDEMQPLFHRRAKNYPTAYLPKLDVNGVLPTKILRTFNEGCARCCKPKGKLLNSFDRSKKYRNKVVKSQLLPEPTKSLW